MANRLYMQDKNVEARVNPIHVGLGSGGVDERRRRAWGLNVVHEHTHDSQQSWRTAHKCTDGRQRQEDGPRVDRVRQ